MKLMELAEEAKIGHLKHVGHGEWDLFLSEPEKRFALLIEKDTIKNCRDMFIVGSVSWNLLNEKLEASSHYELEAQ